MSNTPVPAAATGLPQTTAALGRIPAGAPSVFSDRRSLLRALAGAAVLGAAAGLETSPAAATESSDAIDPVFAAIEKHRRLSAEFSRVCVLTDETPELEGREPTTAENDLYERAVASEDAALDELVETVPLTVAGIRAMLTHVFDRGIFDALDGEQNKACIAAVLRSPVLGGGSDV